MERKDRRLSQKEKAARALGVFFAGMLALTLIGRAADAIILPVVSTARVQQGSIRHVVDLTGSLIAQSEMPALAEEGLTVASVLVRPGKRVEAGEALIRYDENQLKRALDEKRSDLEKRGLQAQLDQLKRAEDPAKDPAKDPDKQDQAQSKKAEEDARKAAQLQARIDQIEVDALRTKVDRLSGILNAGAVLAAPVAGLVTEVLIKPGDKAQGAALRLIPSGAGLGVRAKLPLEEGRHLSVGMAAKFLFAGARYREGAVVTEVLPSEEGVEVFVSLPEGVGAPGQNIEIRVEQETGAYPMRVPVGALAKRDGADGVYRVRAGQSVLGEVEYAEFLPVEVLDKDRQNAAIQASLPGEDLLIASSSKPVRDGDRIRSAP